MSLDFTQDYSNHNLLDDIHRYTKIYKLTPMEVTDVSQGDILLLKTDCGEYGMFIATADTNEEDKVLHVSKLVEYEFVQDKPKPYKNNNPDTDNNCDCCHGDSSLCYSNCDCGCIKEQPVCNCPNCNCSSCK